MPFPVFFLIWGHPFVLLTEILDSGGDTVLKLSFSLSCYLSSRTSPKQISPRLLDTGR